MTLFHLFDSFREYKELYVLIFLLGLIFVLFILVLFRKRRPAGVGFGLAEGPTTAFELGKNPQLRETYSNFRETMFSTISVKFNNIQVIASGGMGIIVSGMEKKTGRKVAIKTISPRLHQDPKAIKFFFQECQAIQKMNHPNIVRIYESANEGFLYYVMEFLEGEVLENMLVRTGILPTRQILKVGTQVARALQHCHSNGIVHRDIKPSNIFITTKDVAKIIDFGVVKMLNSDIKEGRGAIGSPHYASPEQLQGGAVTGKSDIYALGICLYKMASAQFPYPTPDLETKIFQPPKNLTDFNPNLPAELIQIIADCMKLDPSERSDASSLWARLRAVKG
ncbi:MAG: serine/threonine protein kinase [Candidatus Aureabacteria bacterium]|nr:serine/threonine protein kinase [Candidatus Auribacterota bacterium]